ncbi:MAG: hypothetical protein RMH75_05645 [Archaeoglobaceae archaeon]|nr:hypothetical protein [Archaeoglobaceae archaeon]
MRQIESFLIIIAMCVPFLAIKRADMTTYLYWTIISAFYLIFTAFRRW